MSSGAGAHGQASGAFGWANGWIPAETMIEPTQPILRGALLWWNDRLEARPTNYGARILVHALAEWLGRSIATDIFLDAPIADCSLTSACWKFDDDAVPTALGIRTAECGYLPSHRVDTPGVECATPAELLRWASASVFDRHILLVVEALDRIRGFQDPMLVVQAIDGVRSGVADAARRNGCASILANATFTDLVNMSGPIVRQHAVAAWGARV